MGGAQRMGGFRGVQLGRGSQECSAVWGTEGGGARERGHRCKVQQRGGVSPGKVRTLQLSFSSTHSPLSSTPPATHTTGSLSIY